ncbi:hypothetical protein M378DRAFT_17937, partial [Amanita muscaria Koide BX008]
MSDQTGVYHILTLPPTGTTTSAVYFLKAGWAVIFMHWQFGLQPFSRCYSHSTNPILYFLEIHNGNGLPEITLRGLSHELSALGKNAMYYLAAAVSNFFLPMQKMVIGTQSGKGNLSIEMDQVPKILKPMVDEWTKDGYIVSFKLETDPSLLIPKSRTALERYGHQVVIGNDLRRRKYEVVFVSRKHKPNSHAAEAVPEFE